MSLKDVLQKTGKKKQRKKARVQESLIKNSTSFNFIEKHSSTGILRKPFECQLIWMCHYRANNNKINCRHERCFCLI